VKRNSIAFSVLLTIGLAHAAGAPTTEPASRPAPFENEIRAFEAADARHAPPQGAVLFLGSSSIRKWTTVAADFPDLAVINRGFGGSTIPDSTRYLPRIVTPYKPRLIVFFAGDNDLAAKHTPRQVLADFKAFTSAVHEALPETRIMFLSIKPSLARSKLLAIQAEANSLVRDFIATDKLLSYVDVATPMLGPDGQPRPELFGPDGLHMNRSGYELWTSILSPHLKE
jgi:lysophospholipase L1-like esterase